MYGVDVTKFQTLHSVVVEKCHDFVYSFVDAVFGVILTIKWRLKCLMSFHNVMLTMSQNN